MNVINKLKPGDTIGLDCGVLIDNYEILDLSQMIWFYEIAYVDSDYVISNTNDWPYILINYKSIEIEDGR